MMRDLAFVATCVVLIVPVLISAQFGASPLGAISGHGQPAGFQYPGFPQGQAQGYPQGNPAGASPYGGAVAPYGGGPASYGGTASVYGGTPSTYTGDTSAFGGAASQYAGAATAYGGAAVAGQPYDGGAAGGAGNGYLNPGQPFTLPSAAANVASNGFGAPQASSGFGASQVSNGLGASPQVQTHGAGSYFGAGYPTPTINSVPVAQQQSASPFFSQFGSTRPQQQQNAVSPYYPPQASGGAVSPYYPQSQSGSSSVVNQPIPHPQQQPGSQNPYQAALSQFLRFNNNQQPGAGAYSAIGPAGTPLTVTQGELQRYEKRGEQLETDDTGRQYVVTDYTLKAGASGDSYPHNIGNLDNYYAALGTTPPKDGGGPKRPTAQQGRGSSAGQPWQSAKNLFQTYGGATFPTAPKTSTNPYRGAITTNLQGGQTWYPPPPSPLAPSHGQVKTDSQQPVYQGYPTGGGGQGSAGGLITTNEHSNEGGGGDYYGEEETEGGSSQASATPWYLQSKQIQAVQQLFPTTPPKTHRGRGGALPKRPRPQRPTLQQVLQRQRVVENQGFILPQPRQPKRGHYVEERPLQQEVEEEPPVYRPQPRVETRQLIKIAAPVPVEPIEDPIVSEEIDEEETLDEFDATTALGAIMHQIKSLPAVLYTSSVCEECKSVEELLREKYKLPIVTFYLDLLDNADAMKQLLASITGRNHLPHVFICGQYVGGHEETLAYHKADRIPELVKNVCSKAVEDEIKVT